jgi:hypothetical protein
MALQAGMMPDYQREQPEPEQQVAILAGRRERDDGARRLFLDAGPKNDDNRPGNSGAAHAYALILALVLWLLGVSLVALVHVERRFPRAAGVGGAAA